MHGKSAGEPAKVGSVMRRLRVRQNLSQAALAYEADINVSYYCAVENGENNVSLYKFMSICKALGEPADRVMLMILEAGAEDYRTD